MVSPEKLVGRPGMESALFCCPPSSGSPPAPTAAAPALSPASFGLVSDPGAARKRRLGTIELEEFERDETVSRRADQDAIATAVLAVGACALVLVGVGCSFYDAYSARGFSASATVGHVALALVALALGVACLACCCACCGAIGDSARHVGVKVLIFGHNH